MACITAVAYDSENNEVNLDDEELEKRVSKWAVAIKFAKLLAKWGKRAWDWFYCIGLNVAWKCADDVSILIS